MAQPTKLKEPKRQGYGWELLKEAFSPVVDAGKGVATFIGNAAAPVPGSPGAKAVAGIRSVLPGGTFPRGEGALATYLEEVSKVASKYAE